MTAKRKIHANPPPKKSFRNLKVRLRKLMKAKKPAKKRVQAIAR